MLRHRALTALVGLALGVLGCGHGPSHSERGVPPGGSGSTPGDNVTVLPNGDVTWACMDPKERTCSKFVVDGEHYKQFSGMADSCNQDNRVDTCPPSNLGGCAVVLGPLTQVLCYYEGAKGSADDIKQACSQ